MSEIELLLKQVEEINPMLEVSGQRYQTIE